MRRLGRTGLQVSEISLGTVALGLPYGLPGAAGGVPSEKCAAALLHHALDAGVNLIDTARAYGASEEIIGRTLRARRDEFVLVTKAASFADKGLSAAAVQRQVRGSVEQSLSALRTGRLDAVLVHCGVRETGLPEAELEALAELKAAGTIRAAGASVYSHDAALACARSALCEVIEIAYNLLDRRPETAVLHAAAQSNTGVLARSVLLKGVLTRRYHELPPAMLPLREAVARAESVIQPYGLSLPEAAFRYVLAHPDVSSALTGTAAIAELDECLAFARLGPLPPAVVDAVRSLATLDERWLNPGLWPAPA